MDDIHHIADVVVRLLAVRELCRHWCKYLVKHSLRVICGNRMHVCIYYANVSL